MTNPNPAIVDADGGGREQVWPLPTDEQSLLDLIHLCFQQYWDDIWFGTLVQGAAWEVAAPNPPKRISMYDGYATVARTRSLRLAALVQQPQSSPRQDLKPCQIATAAMPRPMIGSNHQKPGQPAVTARPTRTAAACVPHK